MSIARVHYVKHARQRYEKHTVTDAEGRVVRTPVMRRNGQPKTTKGGREITRRQVEYDHDKPLPNRHCEKCSTEIMVGDPYRWFTVGFRSHFKHIRCMESACTPRPSELESSQIATVYAAQEDAEDSINDAESMDDIDAAVQAVAEAVTEVAEAYRQAAVNPNTGSIFNPDLDERADTLDNAASDLESWSYSGDDQPDACEIHDTNVVYDGEEHRTSETAQDVDENADEDDIRDCTCQDLFDEWLAAARDEALETINGVDLG